MIIQLGVAMLWLCPWSGWAVDHAIITLNSGHRIEASIFDWYLLKRASTTVTMAREANGRVALRIGGTFGFVFWQPNAWSDSAEVEGKSPVADDAACVISLRRITGTHTEFQPGAQAKIAGHEVLTYRSQQDGATMTIGFAPTLGCQLMLLREVTYSRIGLPIGIGEFRVTSVNRSNR